MKKPLKLRRKAFDILQNDLSSRLHYHDLGHSLDVLRVCNHYIVREKLNNEESELLRLAALLHDIGFTVTYKEHEIAGAKIAEDLMADQNFLPSQIETVTNLIMATRIPQSPQTFLEKIICDADLDYLGRKDFYQISNKLFEELRAFNLIENKEDWNRTQLRFLKEHFYHTSFAVSNRQPEKEKRIAELEQLMDMNPYSE